MKLKTIIINMVLAVSLAAALNVKAEHVVENGRGVPCGKLVSFLGEVEVFDSSRTHVEDIEYGKKLHCGDWISVENGQAIVEHALGFQFYLGKNSFFQILDPQDGSNLDKDHGQLYRGDVMIVSPLKKEARVTTANARARVSDAKAFLFFAENLLETEYVGLEGKSVLENRWVPQSGVQVGVAKLSTMGASETRVHPSDPRLIDHVSIADRLIALGAPKEINQRLAVITKSEARIRMPVKLKVAAAEPKHEEPKMDESQIRLIATGEFALHQQANRAPASETPEHQTHESVSTATERKPAAVAPKAIVKRAPRRAIEVDPLKVERARLMKKLAELSVSEE